MDLKAHAIHSITKARAMTNSILENFTSQEQWLTTTHPKANHALWVAGHLGLADNHFASKFRPETENTPDGWKELFWFGSEISSDHSVYPNFEQVTNYMKERRENLLKVIDELSEEELNAPAPGANEQGPLAGAPNIGHLLLFAAYHEGIHCGQLTVCHRAIGYDPMYKPQPAAN